MVSEKELQKPESSPKPVVKERVNHPSYYNTDCPKVKCPCCGQWISIECIDIIRDMPTWKGNAIKYLWRAGLKDEEGLSNKEKTIEDLKKAVWYLENKIKTLENE